MSILSIYIIFYLIINLCHLIISIQIVTNIQKQCYEEAIVLLSGSKENMDVSNPRIFGVNIPYNQARVLWPDTSGLHNMSIQGINSSTDKFTMMIHDTTSSIQKKSVVSKIWIWINKLIFN